MTYTVRYIDYQLIKKILFDSNISGNTIEINTGFSRDSVYKLRRGDKNFDGIRLKSLLDIQQWIMSDDWKNYVNIEDYKDMVEL